MFVCILFLAADRKNWKPLGINVASSWRGWDCVVVKLSRHYAGVGVLGRERSWIVPEC